MTFRSFYFFYLLTILLIVWGFVTGDLWTFFILTSTASVLTAATYHLLYKSGRQTSNTLIMVHFGLVFVGLPLTLNIYRAVAILVNANAPDTTAFGGNFSLFLSPTCLLAALVIFIIAISSSKKTPV